MDRDIINHPWGQSQDWTSKVKDYSPSHWLSGPPRAPYGFQGQPPLDEPQMPPESDQQPSYGPGPVTSGSVPDGDIYSPPGVIYAPQPYDQYVNPGSSQARVMEYTGQINQNQQQNIKEEKIDWYKILYTGSIILMGIGSVAVAVIQYKSYTDKKKQQRGYHFDIENERS